MASERPVISLPPPQAQASGRLASPSPSRLRQRGLARASTFTEGRLPVNRRRGSLFSEGISDSRKSFRSSTEDLFLPRVTAGSALDNSHEFSHWHSVPLGLALLPAVGGLFFSNGSAVITDITLLALAAIFLNWSVRLPWDWYLSAQATKPKDAPSLTSFEPIAEESIEDLQAEEDAAVASANGTPPTKAAQEKAHSGTEPSSNFVAARQELQVHELLALLSCFVFPAVGAWLLHAIRSQLSRPSEGLVSNYNIIIFLLAAEIRPMSHLVKMIQARTLHLQRIVSSNTTEDENELDNDKVLDIAQRLEELEAHVADSAEKAKTQVESLKDTATTKTIAQATNDMQAAIQPELDALNRAVRKYEKRTTISAVLTEKRLQDLETRLNDVVVLAAAAQRDVQAQPRNFVMVLMNWVCGAIVLPVQFASYILSLPSRVLTSATVSLSRLLVTKRPTAARPHRQGSAMRLREKTRRPVT